MTESTNWGNDNAVFFEEIDADFETTVVNDDKPIVWQGNDIVIKKYFEIPITTGFTSFLWYVTVIFVNLLFFYVIIALMCSVLICRVRNLTWGYFISTLHVLR